VATPWKRWAGPSCRRSLKIFRFTIYAPPTPPHNLFWCAPCHTGDLGAPGVNPLSERNITPCPQPCLVSRRATATLYNPNLGNTDRYGTIASIVHQTKYQCRKWLKQETGLFDSKHKHSFVNRKWKGISRAGAKLYSKAMENAIMAEYAREQRGAAGPDRMWASKPEVHAAVQVARNRRRLRQDPRFRTIFYARKRVRHFWILRGL
jgi:hypothetical protein